MYSEKEARKVVLQACHKLTKEKLIARTWGNISARISETEMIITPSGLSYDHLTEKDLVKYDITSGEYVGSHKPSSEKGIHASVYMTRPECNFVIHTHQFYASAICAEEKSTDFAPCAKYGLSGTKGLKANVLKVVKDNPDKAMFLMAKHGAICLGENCDDAFEKALELETKCKKLFDEKKHGPKFPNKPWLDDYAQMFSSSGQIMENEDAEAVIMVSEKNYAASQYVSSSRPVAPLIALLEHTVYVKKYSKLKDK